MFLALMAFAVTLWASFHALGNHSLWLALTVFMAARTVLLGLKYPALERQASHSG